MGRGTHEGLRITRRKGSKYFQITGTHFSHKIRKSTGTTSREEAEMIRARIVEKFSRMRIHGDPGPVIDFNDAGVKYLQEARHKTIKEDARCIKDLAVYIGNIPMDQVYRGYEEDESPTPLQQFVLDCAQSGSRMKKPLSARSINYSLGVLNTIGKLAATRWRRSRTQLVLSSWQNVPLVDVKEARSLGLPEKKQPYPISWAEQAVLFNFFPEWFRTIALFLVNTGLRDSELRSLRWEWIRKCHDTGIEYFVIPGKNHKNNEDRFVILNSLALEIISKLRGKHPDYVFTSMDGRPIAQALSTHSCFRKAKKEAAEKISGISKVTVHSFRHTISSRLRGAGVTNEDRKFLIGHKGGDITTHYSTPDLVEMVKLMERIIQKKNDTLTLLRKSV